MNNFIEKNGGGRLCSRFLPGSTKTIYSEIDKIKKILRAPTIRMGGKHHFYSL
jgi:hypothetical protein